jgi:hypothetical protein
VRLLWHIALAIILASLGGVFMRLAPSPGLVPNLMIPLVIYYGLMHPLPAALLFSTFVGYLFDRACLAPTGLHICLFAWATLAVRMTTTFINLTSPLGGMAASFFMQGFVSILSYVMMLTLTGHAAFPTLFAAIQLPSMAVCAGCCALTWPLQQYIDKPKRQKDINLLRGG